MASRIQFVGHISRFYLHSSASKVYISNRMHNDSERTTGLLPCGHDYALKMASVSSLGRATAVKRLRKEFEKMRKAPAPGISARPRYNSARDEVDWFTWDCAMVGPVDSPYEDGLFRALI